MASTQRSLFILLNSPPSLRAEVVRHIFAVGATRSFATNTSSTLNSSRSVANALKHIEQSKSRIHIGTRRFASTVAPTPPTTGTAPPTPPKPSRIRRFLLTTSLVAIFFVGGFTMAAAPAAAALNAFVNPPSDAESLGLYEPATPTAEAINAHLINHPLAQRLRADPRMTESRPHLKMPAAYGPHNLMTGTLIGERRIAVPPLAFFATGDLPSSTQLFYIGDSVNGYPGMVHGGLLATLLDEGLARACFPALPNKIAVTATLNISYRAPVMAEQYVVLRAETTKLDGRKAWVRGWIESLGEDGGEGVKLVEAEALFIEPKAAKHLASLPGRFR